MVNAGTKLVKPSHITFESEAKILGIVAELKAVELSGDEDEPLEKRKQHKSTVMMARVDSQHRTRYHQSAPPRIVDFASLVDWRNDARRITHNNALEF